MNGASGVNAHRLGGKVAIVTGAGSSRPDDSHDTHVAGTGEATAILFARQGAKVLLVDTSAENARSTLKAIEQDGGIASVFVADVTNDADCRAMVEAVMSRYGGLNVLVNNVGRSCAGTVTQVDGEDWDRVMDVCLKSMMLTCRHAIPKMVESGGGSIINVSSIDALRANWWPNVAYAAAKGGVISLTTNMAVHHGRDNIRVNAIAPGHIRAPMTGNISQEMRDLRRLAGPLGTEGTAWDIAWAAVFLASDESRWITGAVLPVDAGTLAATPLSMLPHLHGAPWPSGPNDPDPASKRH